MDKRKAMEKVEQMDLTERLATLSENSMTQIKSLVEKAVLEEKSTSNTEKTEQDRLQSGKAARSV